MQGIAIIVAIVGGLIFLAHLFSGIFSRTKIPSVLLLIIIGIALGPASGLVSPLDLGVVGPIFANITLVVILFQGGLSLKLSTLRSALGDAVKLAGASFFLTMIATAALAHWLVDLEWIPAFILGAIIASTSEAIVIPLVKQLKMGGKSQAILSLESSINDVLCIAITLALIEAYWLGKVQVGPITGNLVASFVVAIVFGFLGAFVWSILLNRIRTIPNAMFTTVAFAFALYGLVETLGFSGAIAALAFGITLGNVESIRFPTLKKPLADRPVGLNETERAFFSEASFLLITFFFIYLGISLKFTHTWLIVLGIVFTAIVFLLRIPAVRVSAGKSVAPREASILAVMAPKGLAAAVLASIPAQQGLTGGELIRDLAYGIIFASIIATSVLVIMLERTRLSNAYERLFLATVPGRPRWKISLLPPRLSKRSLAELDKDKRTITPAGPKMFGSSEENNL